MVSAGALGKCSEELDAPSNGCVRVSLGCRGAFDARPSESEENNPLGFGSSPDDIAVSAVAMSARSIDSSQP